MRKEKELDQAKDGRSDIAMQALWDVICNIDPPSALPVELKENAMGMEIYNRLVEIRKLIDGLAEGALSKTVSSKGYMAGMLKTLQANLRHLTWQSKMVAAGDFSQRVAFMGDFAASFNAMVTALATSQAALKTLASIDGLTGLANRRMFFEIGEAELKGAHRYGRQLAVMVLDLDHFKKVNDTYGHHVGDRVLHVVAETFKQTVRSVDTVGRIGGEEFAIILPETSSTKALSVAQRIIDNIRGISLPVDDNKIVQFTISIGVAQLTEQDVNFGLLLQKADKALYRAKNTGRDRVVLGD